MPYTWAARSCPIPATAVFKGLDRPFVAGANLKNRARS